LEEDEKKKERGPLAQDLPWTAGNYNKASKIEEAPLFISKESRVGSWKDLGLFQVDYNNNTYI